MLGHVVLSPMVAINYKQISVEWENFSVCERHSMITSTWAVEKVTNNRVSEVDEILAELFKMVQQSASCGAKVAFISYASNVMPKNLQSSFQHYIEWELLDI